MAFWHIKTEDSRGVRWLPVHEETHLKLSPSMFDRLWSMDLGTVCLVFNETSLGSQ